MTTGGMIIEVITFQASGEANCIVQDWKDAFFLAHVPQVHLGKQVVLKS